jgi:hypothetical protein
VSVEVGHAGWVRWDWKDRNGSRYSSSIGWIQVCQDTSMVYRKSSGRIQFH